MAIKQPLDIASSPEFRQIKRVLSFIAGAVVVIFVLVVLFGSMYTISAGERGVLLTFGKPDTLAKTEGLHFKVPIIQQVVKMDVKTQKYVIEKATSASSDLQTVTTDVAVNFYITPETVPNLYTKVGIDYESKVIQPAVFETVKAVTAKYTAEELITKREEVKNEIDTLLRERLRAFDINLQTTSITNFDFSDVFNQAIENKVVNTQNALASQVKLAQVQFEAQQRIAQADGEAKAIQIQTEALNRIGGQNYLTLKYIEKWDGKVSLVNGGGSSIVDLRNIGSTLNTSS